MGIDEFMYYYGAQELNKMLAYEEIDIEEDLDIDKILAQHEEVKGDIIKEFDDGKTVIGNQQLRRRLTPRHQSSVRQTSSSRSPRLQSSRASPPRANTPHS